jgi:hypothetical protein
MGYHKRRLRYGVLERVYATDTYSCLLSLVRIRRDSGQDGKCRG